MEHWVALNAMAAQKGYNLTFCSGLSARERGTLDEFKKRAPDALVLPAISKLSDFMATLAKLSLFVGGDIGPLVLACLQLGCLVQLIANDGLRPAPVIRFCEGPNVNVTLKKEYAWAISHVWVRFCLEWSWR